LLDLNQDANLYDFKQSSLEKSKDYLPAVSLWRRERDLLTIHRCTFCLTVLGHQYDSPLRNNPSNCQTVEDTPV